MSAECYSGAGKESCSPLFHFAYFFGTHSRAIRCASAI